MAASHYDKTWVKLNAPWSKGFQNKSKPDESIYWRSSPEHVTTKPFLVDGDLGFNLDGTNALQGQQFIGESDVNEHEADFRNEYAFDFKHKYIKNAPPAPPPPPQVFIPPPAPLALNHVPPLVPLSNLLGPNSPPIILRGRGGVPRSVGGAAHRVPLPPARVPAHSAAQSRGRALAQQAAAAALIPDTGISSPAQLGARRNLAAEYLHSIGHSIPSGGGVVRYIQEQHLMTGYRNYCETHSRGR